jgi:hypothetical protein
MVSPRYAARRARGGGEGEGEGPPRRKGNEGLIIGLIIGGLVIALLVYFLSSGGKMGESDVQDAKAVFRKFLMCCLENREAEGMALVQPREMLRDEQPNDIKEWYQLPPERIRELTKMAFNGTRMRVIGKPFLELDSMTSVDKILAAAEVRTMGSLKRVDLSWTWRGETWNATLSRIEGPWLVWRIDKFSK